MVDANILIAGIGWPRFPYEVLRHAAHRDFQVVLSPFIMKEARKNTSRLFSEELQTLEDFFAHSHYEAAKDPSKALLKKYPNIVRHKNDIPVALAAIQAKVDFLISQDKDITAQDASTEQLRQLLTIILPGTFLREYMGWTSRVNPFS